MDYVCSMDNGICTFKNGCSFPINSRKSHELKQAFIDYNFMRRHERNDRGGLLWACLYLLPTYGQPLSLYRAFSCALYRCTLNCGSNCRTCCHGIFLLYADYVYCRHMLNAAPVLWVTVSVFSVAGFSLRLCFCSAWPSAAQNVVYDFTHSSGYVVRRDLLLHAGWLFLPGYKSPGRISGTSGTMDIQPCGNGAVLHRICRENYMDSG